ncbi:craniofacial development protein 2-like [Schistocerca americana]|uniref:craniofacial development protein 2-like n=1 Tax=Schistocerca americana TaxID=7009 RepID=UPI001F502ED2|nr:craniofacial development protein 2-like [Schistocerca americana]
MTIDNMEVYYLGNSDSQHRNGVGIILDEYASKSVKSILPISDRVISLHLQTKQTNINLIQIYAPTADKDQEETGKFYEELTQAIGTSKSRDIVIIMGDFNAKIGEGSEGDLIGPFGLGTRNERGDLLSQFCQENNLSITNTFFKLPKRRLYTWKSPRDCNEEVCRNQIDFILINKRYKNSIHGVKTYPGADIFSDHNLLVAKFHVKLKAMQKKQKKDYINTTILRDPLTKQKTSEEINKELVRIKNNQTEDIDGKWELIKDTLNNACKNTMATKHNMKKKWMTEKILQLMEQRRILKNRDESEYKRLHAEIRKETRRAKEEWYKEQCSEIESYETRHDSFNLHKKVKDLAGFNKKKSTSSLLDKNGKIIPDVKGKLDRWTEYVKELFEDTRKDQKIL